MNDRWLDLRDRDEGEAAARPASPQPACPPARQRALRIGLCGTALTRKARRGGIANYFRQLVWHLAEIDHENDYTLLLHPHTAEAFSVEQPNFHTRVVQLPGRQAHYWEQLVLPFTLRRLPLDLVHFVGFPAVWGQNLRSVVTVHDLTYRTRPETRGDVMSRFHWSFFGDRGARRADHVIAVSEYTRRDLEGLLNLPPERITVIHEAPASIFRPVAAECARAVARGKYGIEGEYILFVGTLEPVKNLGNLLEAYALARQAAVIEPSLVVVGQRGWQFSDLFARVEELGLRDEVVFTGYVPDDDLPALYSGASVFVLPSRYEGFGLPVLEAMACGTPVITSNVASLPEVAGDAALLVDPADVAALAEALEQVCGDARLRRRLRQAGLARAAQFSWRRCAEQTRKVYEQVVAGLLREDGSRRHGPAGSS